MTQLIWSRLSCGFRLCESGSFSFFSCLISILHILSCLFTYVSITSEVTSEVKYIELWSLFGLQSFDLQNDSLFDLLSEIARIASRLPQGGLRFREPCGVRLQAVGEPNLVTKSAFASLTKSKSIQFDRI